MRLLLMGAVLLGMAGSALAQPSTRLESLRQEVQSIQSIAEEATRVQAFRELATTTATELDRFGLLRQEPSDKTPTDHLKRAYDETAKLLTRHPHNGVKVQTPPPSELGRHVPPIAHRERLDYDAGYVRELAPKPGREYSLHLIPYEMSLYNAKLIDANGRADFMARQQSVTPQILYLESGVMNLPMVMERLRAQGDTTTLQSTGKTYILRKPLIIGPNATLLISGQEVEALRLSQESGAYLVNAGRLYVLDTRVTGWSETKAAPALAEYAQKYAFRPFLLGWSRSQTFLAGSTFTALGYANSKSYGVTFSSGPERLLRFREEKIERPQAVLVENSFRNLYYGFYCYEADDVAIIGNEYVDNIVYGIDPHDYSRRLTIAYNTTYGSQKKHGIIISREVADTAIVGNISFGNQGSGIMVERQSKAALMYTNTAFDNAQDGVSIFENNCAIAAANYVAGNRRVGVNIRNSLDIGVFSNHIFKNQLAGIQGYALNLRKEPGQAKRDYKKDPFTDVVGFSAVDNRMEANGHGLQADGISTLYLRGNTFLRQSPKLVAGEWAALLTQAFVEHPQERSGLLAMRTCSKAQEYMQDSVCRFREEGYFNKDGQAQLSQRMRSNVCAGEAQP